VASCVPDGSGVWEDGCVCCVVGTVSSGAFAQAHSSMQIDRINKKIRFIMVHPFFA